jgi:hypothetical protein
MTMPRFRLSYRRLPALALALLSALPAAAQLNLTGKVTGTDGKGIPGVLVKLKSLKISTLTDAEGAYKIDASTASLERLPGNAPVTPAFRAGRPEFGLFRDESAVRIGVDGRALRFFPGGAGAAFIASASRESEPSSSIGALAARAALKTAAAAYDTLQAGKEGYSPDYKRINTLTGAFDFFLAKPLEFWGDPAAAPAAKNVMTYVFLNRTNGKYADNQITWKFTGLQLGTSTAIPAQTGNLAQQPTLDVPLHHGGRVTFTMGSGAETYVDFMEQTVDNLGWHGNTTRVDGYVFPVAMRLMCSDKDELLGEKYEVFYLGRDRFFAKYKAAMPVEFQSTLDSAKGKRIVAPGKGEKAFGPNDKYANYFNAYFAQLGLTGPGANTQDAFACAGAVFGQNAQLCGAVNRHVAHLPKAQWEKPENFYQEAPANFYAKFFHEVSFQEKAYGFAYDDAAQMAAYAECGKPKTLFVAIGF